MILPVACDVRHRIGTRILLGGLGAASLLGHAVGLPLLVAGSPRTHLAYIWLFGGLFLVYVLSISVVWRWRSEDRILLGVVFGFAFLFRVSLLASPVILSSDVYRYLWDGRVQWAGISPYRYPPAAVELAPLRDEVIHPNINRADKPTVYPPGAELAFAAVALVAPGSLPGWRVFLLACEATTMGLLLTLLRRSGMPRTAVIVYAWSPLVIFEGVQAGHVDLAMLPLVLAALTWRQAGSAVYAGIALGGAVLMKLYPLVLLPAWWRRGDWRFPTAVAATVALGYAPHAANVGLGALGFLPEYLGRTEDHNIGLRALLTYPFGLTGDHARTAAMVLLFALLAGVAVWIGWANAGNAAGLTRAGAFAAAAYLLLVPTSMHPWYVLWMVPFLCFQLWPAWLYFSGAVALSYMSYVVKPAPLPWWAWLAEYGPLYALLIRSAWRARARVPAALASSVT